MNKFGIVVPTKYPDIIAPLLESIKKFEPEPPRILIIDNGGAANCHGFEVIPYDLPNFVFAHAINLGINALGTMDIIALNDDITLLEPNTFQRLHDAAYSNDKIGLISPLVKGCVGCAHQRWYEREKHWKGLGRIIAIHGREPICFPCIYIKHELIDRIGMLDERFTEYGGEDGELCIRARAAGFLTAITREIVVQHGSGGPELRNGRGKTWSLSFARKEKELSMIMPPNPDPTSRVPGMKYWGWMSVQELEWLHKHAQRMGSAVEVGSSIGRSSAALIAGCKGKVYCIDLWADEGGHGYRQFMENVGNCENVVPVKGASPEIGATIPGDIDMVFIDGNHDYEACMADLKYWWPRTKVLICGHDYTHPSYPGVKKAVDEFFSKLNLKVTIAPETSIWYVEKRPQVWGVTMVADEKDIISYTIAHMLSQGVDGLIIANNMSADGTDKILYDWAERYPNRVIVVEDNELAYHQGAKQTKLAGMAAELGAKIIIPFDADELWCPVDPNTTIVEVLTNYIIHVAEIPMMNYFCTADDPEAEPNPFKRIAWRSKDPNTMNKVAYWWRADWSIDIGNHRIIGADGNQVSSTKINLVIHHFPYRSAEQFVHKAIRGNQALQAAPDLGRDTCLHWREYAESVEKHGEEQLKDHYRRNFTFGHNPIDTMVYDPAPYTGKL